MTEQTFLEAIGVFQYFGFQYLLVPLLIFVVVLGVLQKSKIISEKPDINTGVAFALAFTLAVIPGFTDFVFSFLPYLVGFIIILFSISLLFMAMGADTKNIYSFMSHPGVVVLILAVITIVALIAIGNVTGEALSPYGRGNMSQTNPATVAVQRIFSPEVFGTIIFITVIAIGIYMLTYNS